MGLRTFLREVWRYLVFIIVVVVASSAIAFAISSVQQKTYTAQSKPVSYTHLTLPTNREV